MKLKSEGKNNNKYKKDNDKDTKCKRLRERLSKKKGCKSKRSRGCKSNLGKICCKNLPKRTNSNNLPNKSEE